MPLNESSYNTCNQAYRDHSNQQETMVEELINGLETTPESIVAYGCGFGIFERAFLKALATPPVNFTGIDNNGEALARLEATLEEDLPTTKLRLLEADLEEVFSRDPQGDTSLAVHCLYRLPHEDLNRYLQETASRHKNNYIFIDPYTSFWKIFKESRHEAGLETYFAEDVSAMLTHLQIPFSATTFPCWVKIPKDDFATLRKVLAFISYDENLLIASSEEVFSVFASIKGKTEANSWLVANPTVLLKY